MAFILYRLRHFVSGRHRPMTRAEFRCCQVANALLRDSGAVSK
jgi:hypothetical protein